MKYSCDVMSLAMLNFLQCYMILQKYIFLLKIHFLLLSMLKTVVLVLLKIVVKTDSFFSRIL